MKVLGLSAHFHDAAAAIAIDGHIIAAAAEERFSRQKHDPNFPQFAVRFCLDQAGLQPTDLDAVVFYEQPATKFTRVLATTLAGFPRSLGAFTGAMKGWLTEKLFLRNAISAELGIHPALVQFTSHHESHAAHSFLSSGFHEAAVITIDGVGEWDCTTVSLGKRDADEPLQLIESIEYPHSLGLFYAAFTGFLGFRPNWGECSTMALAAFGQPNRLSDVQQVLKPGDDGLYTLADGYLNLLATRDPYTARFRALFGEPGNRAVLAELRAFGPSGDLSVQAQRLADLAASVQAALEEALLGLARRAHEKTGAKALCLGGGVALNCVAVRRLLDDGPFERVFVPPDPGDGGAAIGAALAFSLRRDKNAGPGGANPYLGQALDVEPALEMMPHIPEGTWTRSGPGSLDPPSPDEVKVQRFENEAELLAAVADRIVGGQIVGWCQGRFETGPRALGNRSILIDPSNIDVAHKLSDKVKLRAGFRPYAFSVTTAAANKLLELPGGPLPEAMKWMQMTARVRESERPRVAAAIHIDGTTRPQIVDPEINPIYHRLLEAIGQRNGTAAVLNTSFNESGAPMCATPVDALAMFSRTWMDALVLGNAIVSKEWAE